MLYLLILCLVCCVAYVNAHSPTLSFEHVEPISNFVLQIDQDSEAHSTLKGPKQFVTKAKLERSFIVANVNDKEARTTAPFGNDIHLSFNAFDEEFAYTLQRDDSVFAPNARISIQSENNIQHVIPRPITYSTSFVDSNGNEGHAVATVLSSTSAVDALIFRNNEAYHVQPIERHLADASSNPSAHSHLNTIKSLSQKNGGAGMSVYKLSSLPTHDDQGNPLASCGVQPPSTTFPEDAPVNVSLDTAETTQLSTTPISRNLLLKRWTNCFSSTSELTTVHIALAVDFGTYTAMGSDIGLVTSRIAATIAQANLIYRAQLGLVLSVGDLTIMTTPGVHDWNNIGKGEPGSVCPSSQQLLDHFSAWRKKTYPSEYALVHLITNCFPPPGIVGLAWTGTTCGDYHSSGWSNVMSTLWLTVAHEIAHNMGGIHQFGLGGVLDYGTGKLHSVDPENPGEYGFNVGSRPGICSHLTQAMKGTNKLFAMNNRVPLNRCYSTFAGSVCGNGIIEEGEECDAGEEGSACCTPQCKLTEGSTCSVPSTCCQECKAVDASVTCGQGKSSGFCSRGECAVSKCNSFSNATPCGLSPLSTCRERCSLQGTCTHLGNDPTYLPIGSYCRLENGDQGICSSSENDVTTCVEKQYKWQIESDDWEKCNCEGKMYKKMTCRENSVNIVSQSLCKDLPIPEGAIKECEASKDC